MNFGFSAAMISFAICAHSDVAPGLVADQPGLGAMLAHDADLGLVGECVLEPEASQSAIASPITTTVVVASGFFCVGAGAFE